MKLFDVYPLLPIEPVKAEGVHLWDKEGNKYLDLYGGHAVISIGHHHSVFTTRMKEQLDKIIFYSNSVQIPQQQVLAQKLGALSNYDDYQLFLCNSGAEANENALKLASFHTSRKKIIALKKSFHGRTSGAVAITDNISIQAPVNQNHEVLFIEMNDAENLEKFLSQEDVAAFILEPIQGVGGIHEPTIEFFQKAEALCKKYGTVLILDEVQAGYGRSGKFFAHQWAGIQADLITIAKGMGNGFPIGGVLISPQFLPKEGMLGTTFGGSHLACVAGIAVLDAIKEEHLMENAQKVGDYLMEKLKEMQTIKELRGKGLMIGIEFDFPIKELRQRLVNEHHIFTGYAGANTIRLLPPLCLSIEHADVFIHALEDVLVHN